MIEWLDLHSSAVTAIAAILASMAAPVGAALGVRLALGRHRKERAFDRQLEWREGLVAAAHSLLNTLIELAVLYEAEMVPPGEMLDRQQREVDAFTREVARGDVCARDEDERAELGEATSAFSRAQQETMVSMHSGAPRPVVAQAFFEQATAVRRTQVVIARHQRRHFGFPPLQHELDLRQLKGMTRS